MTNNVEDKSHDTKKIKFGLSPSHMQQSEDMLSSGTEKIMTAPHYGFQGPKPYVFVHAHEWSMQMDCLRLPTDNPEREDLVFLYFSDDLNEHNKHVKVFNPKQLKTVRVCPMVCDDGKFFFWMMKQTRIVTGQEKEHKAHTSARECWKKAQKGWVHIQWTDDGVFTATKDECSAEQDATEPVWPTTKWDMTIQEIFIESVQASGNFISDMDDKRIRDLRFGSANK